MRGRIIALIIKEIQAVWRDKKSRTVLIVPPLVQLVVFSFAATLEVKNVSMAILDQDNSALSYELVQRFHGSPTFKNIRYLGAVSDIKPIIDTQEVILVMHIPQDFSRQIKAGRSADVQLILDGRRSNAAQIVQGYAAQIINQLNEELSVKYRDSRSQSVLVSRNWFNPNLEYIWFTVPSLVGILTTLIGLLVTALSVARERELGTFDQLLVSPLQPYEILIGKTVPALLIGVAEGTVMITAAVLVFGVPFTGSLLLLYAAMVVYLMSVIGVGLFISSLSKTQQQAILGTFVFMAPAVLLSGFATPVENMPEWLQLITYADPLKHFLVVVLGVFLKDMPFKMVFANTWPMAVIALFTLTGAAWFFRRGLE